MQCRERVGALGQRQRVDLVESLPQFRINSARFNTGIDSVLVGFDRVIDSVLTRASATEIGPKGAEPDK